MFLIRAIYSFIDGFYLCKMIRKQYIEHKPYKLLKQFSISTSNGIDLIIKFLLHDFSQCSLKRNKTKCNRKYQHDRGHYIS